MDWAAAFYLTALIAATHVLILEHGATSVYNYPIHLAVLGLTAAGLTIILLNFYLPDRLITPIVAQEESAIPLAEYRKRSGTLGRADEAEERERAQISRARSRNGHFNLRRLRWKLLLVFVAVLLRIWLFHSIQTQVECATSNFTIWVPFIVTLYESYALYCSTHEHLRLRSQPSNVAMQLKIGQSLRGKDVKIVALVFALTIGASSLLVQIAAPSSSYICAGSSLRFPTIPVQQFVAATLDVIVIVCASESVHWGGERSGNPPGRATNPVGWLLIIPSFCILTVVSIVYYFRTDLQSTIMISRPLVLEHMRVYIACICVCVYSTLQLALRYGVRSAAVIGLFLFVGQRVLLATHGHTAAIHPISKSSVILSISTIFVCFISYLWVAYPTSRTTRMRVSTIAQSPILLATLAVVMLFATAVMWSILLPSSYIPHTHPISLLINEATAKHHNFIRDASSSQSLASAVKEYKRRYHRDPPPRFDKWFSFAMNKTSKVIDNFDSIHEDLHPFWALGPQELRYRTWEAVAYPGNKVAGLMVRNGEVFIGPRIPENVRWQVEGLGHIIQTFAEYLPDLDFGMNIEEEPRVAVPHETLSILTRRADTRKGLNLPPTDDGGFSLHRAQQWRKFNEPIKVTRFDMRGIDATFDEYGSTSCNETSPARSKIHWNRGQHCEACAQPHKMQQFVRDWHDAGNVCLQPDLGHLHGLHISPETFKVTHDLMPVFSKAKAAGYLDIRYPSEVIYMDRIAYKPNGEYPDPPYNRKEPTLFWRGRNSGTSSFSERRVASWKGGHRQRFVYLMNHATSSSHGLTLLPTTNKQGFSYRYVNPSLLRKYLLTDVGIPKGISECRAQDCKDQFALFEPGKVQDTNFQQHWSYKFIMDLDGLGASQRFIPFLRSNSLPFKASIYREWWTDRVTAWKHFVPVDIRMTEMWSLLAYFGGWPSEQNVANDDEQPQWLMPPHNIEGQKIAEAGRQWADVALRKEDMEIYLFRLLLEWGRMTDDARDSIGYTL